MKTHATTDASTSAIGMPMTSDLCSSCKLIRAVLQRGANQNDVAPICGRDRYGQDATEVVDARDATIVEPGVRHSARPTAE